MPKAGSPDRRSMSSRSVGSGRRVLLATGHCIVARQAPCILPNGGRYASTYVGEYATSTEMAGASLTIFRLDDEFARLLDAPARSPFFCQA